MSFPNNDLEAIAFENAKRMTSDDGGASKLYINYLQSLRELETLKSKANK